MQLSGSKTLHLSPEQSFALITNPDVLARCIPGVKRLQSTSETTYEADLEIGVAGIKGQYKGIVEMADINVPESYRLRIQGEGSMGFLEADVHLQLTPAMTDTEIHYDGDATVGGKVAGVGQRVLSGVAKLLIGQFFTAIGKEAEAFAKE